MNRFLREVLLGIRDGVAIMVTFALTMTWIIYLIMDAMARSAPY